MLTASPEAAVRNSLEKRFQSFAGLNVSRTFAEKCWNLKRLPGLLTDAEFADDSLVALGIVFLEVVEQATALADQHEKAAARAVVFLMCLEVLRQLANPFAEQGNLDFWAPGIARMRAVLVNEGFLLLSG
jgi:hypothetical protein